MSLNNPHDIIKDLSHDDILNFYDNIHEAQSSIEQNLMQIHKADDQLTRFNSILSAINVIKTHSHIIFLDCVSGLIQALEDLTLMLMGGKIKISEGLSELLLLCFDEIKSTSESLVSNTTIDILLLEDLRVAIHEVMDEDKNQLQELIIRYITKFSVRVEDDLVYCAREVSHKNLEKSSIPPFVNILQEIPDSTHMTTFKGFSRALDHIMPFWELRTEKILNICLLINRNLKKTVNNEQLAAAVYMHDTAMAFLPESLLKKSGKYSDDELKQLQQHPSQTYGLMKMMGDWQEAAEMVFHHHERINGQGYPNGLKGDEICMGANIIAVADTFYSITHLRNDRKFYKSITRAVSEINKNNNILFHYEVVSAFNDSLLEFLHQIKDIDIHNVNKIV